LLLAQILECLPGQLLRGNWIARLLQERCPRLLQEGNHSRVESIEGFAKPQGVKWSRRSCIVCANDVPTLPPSSRNRLNKPTAAPRSSGGI
jgi:hypothetical protein